VLLLVQQVDGPVMGLIYMERGIMKKRVKRRAGKSTSKRARQAKKTTSTKSAKTTKTTPLLKVKRAAKKAALAAGVAAIGTALSELKPSAEPSDQGAFERGRRSGHQ
jgi:hypothetical protein